MADKTQPKNEPSILSGHVHNNADRRAGRRAGGINGKFKAWGGENAGALPHVESQSERIINR